MRRREDGGRKRFGWIAAAAVTVAALGAAPVVAPVVSHGVKAKAAKVETVTLAIRHRVFHNFSDVQKVRLDQDFVVGDTQYTGRIVRYVPDFMMDLTTGAITSRSEEPRNPAFQIVVKEKGVPQDTTWALLNMPPHFAEKSMLAFKVARIDFIGHDPVLPDTTHVPAMPPHGAGMTGGHPGAIQMPPGMPAHPAIPSTPSGTPAEPSAEKKTK